MITAIDHKDHYTRRHSEEVTEYALWIAEELGLSEEQKHALRLGGLLHDVGKIGIPDSVLLKPGLLTAEEYEAMKQHTVLGAVMLAALPEMEKIVPLARSHHERWDGQGYPDGLAGEQIPLLARILAVADAFSAMTTDRPYRKGMDVPAALTELQRHRGTQFDPAIVDVFVAAVQKRIESGVMEKKKLPLAA
jgi:putative nucleotidyltransferase with HDIG domain